MIAIRQEEPGDVAGIRAVVEAAFGRPDEADGVDAVRRNGHTTLSLVALADGRIVGHVLFSPVVIETGGAAGVVALAPLAVLPEFQGQGIGSALARAGLDECRRLGFGCVVLLGHPTYYPRFGFVPASRYGLRCTFDAPDEAFMAVELETGFLVGRGGIVRFSAEWDGV